MKNHSIGLPIIGAVAIATGFFGCADENPWGNTGIETGSINLTLTADYDFNTAKPVFRSGEETRAEEDLSNYATVPSADNFQIKLENTNGYIKEWGTLSAFNQDEAIKSLATGLYTITAYYGDMKTSGEDKPYFEAKSSFTILPDKTSEVELNAELKNSMVCINYTDDFKNYMKEFTTSLSVAGSTEIASTTYNETNPVPETPKAIFVEPKDVTVSIAFTTKETGKSSSVKIDNFAAVAKTLYKMTFDINHKNNGFATLTVTFDETTDSETVEVDLTEKLFAVDAPTITYTETTTAGTAIESGATINMLENPTVAFSVLTPGGLNTATLTVNGNGASNFTEVIDLRTTDPATLTSKGIDSKGFNDENIEATDNIATLDITKYAKNLASGDYSVKLDITDKLNRTSSFQLYANTEAITATPVIDATADITYGAAQTELVLDYNGNDYQELIFKASDADGNMIDVQSSYVKSEMQSTRGYETWRCHYTVHLPYSKKSKVNFEAYNKVGEPVSTIFEVPVKVPEYDVLVDAYSQYAYLKIVPTNSDDMSTIMKNLQMQIGDNNVSISKDINSGKITLTKLTQGVQGTDDYGIQYRKGHEYIFLSSLTGEEWKETSVLTEDELPIPNGKFSKQGHQLKSASLLIGGDWYASKVPTARPRQHHSSFERMMPAGWHTINSITASANAKNQNTWYVVPSSWLENGSGFMRNVGYSHQGKTLGDPKGTNTDHYCRDHPEETDLHKAAGVLSLGNYNFSDGSADGIAFSSRPSSISFDYTYTLKKDKNNQVYNDQGYGYIEIIDENNKSLGSKTFTLSEGSGTQTITFNYEVFSNKGTNLKIYFKSSNSSNPPIYIPSGDELSEGDDNAFDISNKTFPANQYHAVATGSELWIDNVKATYASEPTVVNSSNTPKKTHKNSKRR